MYHLNTSEEFGRGLYATHDIKENTILFTAELLILSPVDTVKVNETDLKCYTFKYNENQDCLVLGDGEIFNHSNTPNVGYKIGLYNGRQVMFYWALKNITANEQLFIDYSSDIKVNMSNYTINLAY